MTPDATALTEYEPAAPRDIVEVADKTLLPDQGYGGLTLELQQPGGITAITMQKVAHVPALGRNFLSTRRASERSGEPFQRGYIPISYGVTRESISRRRSLRGW